MSQKPETLFSNAIRKALPHEIYSMKNNNEYVAGVPDLWFSGVGGDLWVEMKFIPKLPVRVPIRPYDLLSALQSEWLSHRYEEGRNVAVIIGCKRAREYEGIILQDRAWDFDIEPDSFDKVIRSKSSIVEFIQKQVL